MTRSLFLTAASLLALAATPVVAQVVGEDVTPYGAGYDAPPGDLPAASPASESGRRAAPPRAEILPYVELNQLLIQELEPTSETLTYTTVVAGVDAAIRTRRVEAQASVRYEHQFGYDEGVADSDNLSGIVRAAATIGGGLSVEAGALAAQQGLGTINSTGDDARGETLTTYSVYGGPSFEKQLGAVTLGAAYRIGYSKVDADEGFDGNFGVGGFDDSVSQAASVSAGVQPGPLPVGLSAVAGWNREDAGLLDQRLDNKYVRGDVTVPITPALAAVGGIGYEDIEISERDALRDAGGVPIVDEDGRFVTDEASPRLLSYDQEGLIWDVGVLWRPSRRTSLEARVGERYGSTTYYGSFSWQPREETSVGIAVFDTVTGYGDYLTQKLSALPTSFRAVRNPLTGNLSPCVGATGGGLCLDDILGAADGAAFRARGVSASFSTVLGRWNTGAALGYTRREILASRLGANSLIAGSEDESWYGSLTASRDLDERSSLQTNIFASYYDPALDLFGDTLALGANASYGRQLWRGLSANAALGIDHQHTYDDSDFSETSASALLGLRYDF